MKEEQKTAKEMKNQKENENCDFTNNNLQYNFAFFVFILFQLCIVINLLHNSKYIHTHHLFILQQNQKLQLVFH